MRDLLAAFGIYALVALALPASAVSAQQETVIDSTMQRAVFKAIMARGPQQFIAGLKVKPHSVRGRFVGFKLVGHTPESPVARSTNIRVGDVILSVNGHSLERPDQFMRAWETIQTAKSLEIRLLRAADRFRYRWTFLP